MFTVTIGEEMLEKLRAMLEDEDEDEKIVVEDVPFIADNDFLTKYGKAFELSFNEDRQVVLTALNAQI